MRYCNKCIIPDTRPHIEIDKDGICNACRAHGTKNDIDWESRKNDFEKVIARAKSSTRGYDCIIPVSGGKDSTWQIIKCLEYDLKILAVTWKTPGRSLLGQQNLDNLVQLGVDHIDYQINPEIEKKFMWLTLDKYGSTAIPMHLAMFNIPLMLAFKMSIPLIIWGENPAFEYGGKSDAWTEFRLTADYLKKYGVTHGTTAEDWVKYFSVKDLAAYFGPSDEDLAKSNISAIFLGHFFHWDPLTNLQAAEKRGFLRRKEGPKTGYYDYASIDDDFISIHHWIKWYKFGITRLFDNLSVEIRNNRIRRDEAISILKKFGEQRPVEDILAFCKFVGKTDKDFFQVIEKFRNSNIWRQKNGHWTMPEFIIPDWDWQ